MRGNIPLTNILNLTTQVERDLALFRLFESFKYILFLLNMHLEIINCGRLGYSGLITGVFSNVLQLVYLKCFLHVFFLCKELREKKINYLFFVFLTNTFFFYLMKRDFLNHFVRRLRTTEELRFCP